MLNLQEIFSFIEVAKAQGFSNASRKTGLPKSTLSRHVQNLEERLALNLFQRSTRRLQLTPAGEDFFRKAQALAGGFENLERQFQSQSKKIDGLLRITCAVEVGVFLLPPVLNSFRLSHPEIDFDLHLSDQSTNLIDSKIDVAIRAGFLEDSSIICKKILDTNFKLFAHADFKNQWESLAKGKRAQIPLIEFTTKPFAQLIFMNEGKKLVFNHSPRFFSNSLRMSAELAMLGAGICALPSFMGDRYVEQGRLAPIFSEWGTTPHPLHLLYLDQTHLPLRVRLFIDHLMRELSN